MITIFSATNRPDSNSKKVASLYLQLLKEKDVEAQLYSFEDLPEDIVFSETFGNRSERFQKVIKNFIEPAGRLIFIVPEYNVSFPGVLKVFLDSVEPRLWEGKKTALTGVATGRAGNLLGLDQLTSILHYLKMDVYHNKPLISSIHTHFDADFSLNNSVYIANIEKQINGFLHF